MNLIIVNPGWKTHSEGWEWRWLTVIRHVCSFVTGHSLVLPFSKEKLLQTSLKIFPPCDGHLKRRSLERVLDCLIPLPHPSLDTPFCTEAAAHQFTLCTLEAWSHLHFHRDPLRSSPQWWSGRWDGEIRRRIVCLMMSLWTTFIRRRLFSEAIQETLEDP